MCVEHRIHSSSAPHVQVQVLELQPLPHHSSAKQLVVKALRRRATANTALARHPAAIADLKRAQTLAPGDMEVQQQLECAWSSAQEQVKALEIRRQLQAGAEGEASDRLRVVQDLVQLLEEASKAGATIFFSEPLSQPFRRCLLELTYSVIMDRMCHHKQWPCFTDNKAPARCCRWQRIAFGHQQTGVEAWRNHPGSKRRLPHLLQRSWWS